MANLLQTQDSLKSLSDQQLMSEMQDPTGQVPQFLVLSELKRRKDMRQQNQSPPSSTVADDLTQGPQQPGQSVATAPGMMPAQAPQQPASAPSVGIQSLASPVPGMREGGVVRMSGGGDPPPSASLRGMTVEQLNALLDPTPTVTEPPTENAFSRFLRGGRRENLPEQQFIPIDPQTQSRAFGAPPRSAIEQALRYRMSEPGKNTAAAQEVTTQAIPATGSILGERIDPEQEEVLPTPPPYAPPPQRQTATGNAATQGNGVGALVRQALTATPTATPTATAAPTAAPAAAPASAIPPGTTIDRSHLNSIMERMERERVNPATERENARNMALLQAGLAIAGGTSPHFAQNLAGAIPAIQGYQTQMTNLRKEGRDELKAQFDLAKADVEAQYHQGMLTEHQRNSAISRLNAELQARTSLETTRMQVAGHIQSAGIAAGGRDRLTDMDKTVADILKDNPDMKPSEARRQAADMLRGFTARGEAALDTQNQRDIGAALRNPELRTSVGNTIRRQLGRPATVPEIDAAIRSTFTTPGTAPQTSPAPPAFNYNPATGTLGR